QIRKKDIKAILLVPQVAERQIRNLYRRLTGRSDLPPNIEYQLSPLIERYLNHIFLVRMTVMYRIEYKNLELREVARAYNKHVGTVELVPAVLPYAGTETRRIKEKILTAAQRAYREEAGLPVRQRDIELLSALGDEFGPIHKSAVYHGFISQQIYQEVRIILPEQRWPNGRGYFDEGVGIFQQWFEKSAR
ncbi:MAG: hypothetical protein AAB927_02195, partial [Patescibacteria group bacterium]